MASVGNALLTSLIIINGKVEGTWKRVPKKDKVEIKPSAFRKFNKAETRAVNEAVENYRKFFIGNRNK